jgi:hypothetical protein
MEARISIDYQHLYPRHAHQCWTVVIVPESSFNDDVSAAPLPRAAYSRSKRGDMMCGKVPIQESGTIARANFSKEKTTAAAKRQSFASTDITLKPAR